MHLTRRRGGLARRLVPALCVSLAAFSPAAAAAQFSTGRVIVVDTQLGPGSDVATLKEAADLAREGDLLLVRSGRYAGFDMADQAVRVCADSGAIVEIGGTIRISGLGGAQQFLLRGLRSPSTPPYFRLNVIESLGPVWVEHCELGRPAGSVGGDAEPAVLFQSATSGAILRSDIGGSHGDAASDGAGAPAIRAEASNVWVYDSTLRGGDAAPRTGAAGAPGLQIENYELFASNNLLVGGTGGSGADCQDGGAGAATVAGSLLITTLHLHSNAYQPGVGGSAGPCSTGGTSDGTDGARISLDSGTSEDLSGAVRTFSASSPVRAGQPIQFAFGAPVGERVLTFGSLFMDIDIQYALAGVLLLELPLMTLYNGPVPIGGSYDFDRTADLLPPGFDHLALFVQTLFMPATDGHPVLGSASAVIILRN